MNTLFKESFILFAISAVAAILLTFSYQVTKPIIEENFIKAKNEAMKEILPAASYFEEDVNTNLPENIESLNIGYDENDDEVGYIVSSTTFGYGGQIDMMVGYNSDETISNIEIIKHAETPGLGALATEEEFKSQFINKSGDLSVVKSDTPNENEISAITSSTITTVAVVVGTNNATNFISSYSNGINDFDMSDDHYSEDEVDVLDNLLPIATNFMSNEDFNIVLPDNIIDFAIGYNDTEEIVGYVVTCVTNGYAGEIELMVSFDTTPSINGLEIINHKETTGLSSLIENDSFESQFIGKNEELVVTIEEQSKSNEISSITGATDSTVAVVNATNNATQFIKNFIGGAF